MLLKVNKGYEDYGGNTTKDTMGCPVLAWRGAQALRWWVEEQWHPLVSHSSELLHGKQSYHSATTDLWGAGVCIRQCDRAS
jgi:hypothetical protein